MTITYEYEPPEEGVYKVDVTFSKDGEVILQCPVSTVFNPGPFDRELTEQKIQVFVEQLESRIADNVPVSLGSQE